MAISTMEWGAVNAASLDVLNRSIAKQNKLPSAFTLKETLHMFGMEIECSLYGEKDNRSAGCEWEKWVVNRNSTGGDIALDCYIKNAYVEFVVSGSNSERNSNSLGFAGIYDISGSKIAITVSIKLEKTKTNGDAIRCDLKVDETKNVTIITDNCDFKNLPKDYVATIGAILSDYYKDNIGQFDAVFCSIMLNNDLAKNEKLKWLIPTAVGYAAENSASDAYFGVLTMLDNDPFTVQSMEFSIDIIECMNKFNQKKNSSEKANAVLAISEEKFFKNFIAPTAVEMFDDTFESDFEIQDDKISITNKNKIKWKNFGEDGQTGTILAGKFTITLEGTDILIQIYDVESSPSVGLNAYTSMDQKIKLTVEHKKDGGYVLIPDFSSAFSKCNIHTSINETQGLKIFENVMLAISVAATLALGCGAVAGCIAGRCAATVTEVAETTAEAIITGETIANETGEEIAAIVEEAAEAIEQGTTVASKVGKWTKSIVNVSKWVTLAAGTAFSVEELVKNINKKNYNKFASLENFAANLMNAFSWPEMGSIKIVGAELCNVLLLYAKIDD